MNLENDIQIALNLLKSNGREKSQYRIYRNTNENLDLLFRDYDFTDKKVLSVMASSDQPFSAYYKGAKQVDTFDINPLAEYYFYLKKWFLMKYGSYHISALNGEIKESLTMQDNSLKEATAYEFWNYILSIINDPRYYQTLYYSNMFYQSEVMYELPYEKDTDKMIELIKDKQSNFKKINFFEPIDNTSEKYDIIILSNMLEYITGNLELERTTALNIKNLLKNNGFALCSNIIYAEGGNYYVYTRHLSHEHGLKVYNNHPSDDGSPIGYTYKKK